MADPMFDMELRRLRRDRAARGGPALFLHERAFDDILERIALVQRRFRSALLIGCPDPDWPARLGVLADGVQAADPGPLFAAAAKGRTIVEDQVKFDNGGFDLCVAVGTLDTVNELQAALQAILDALRPDSLLIGAISGGDTLPLLRTAMRTADAAVGLASPHVHPRIEPAALGMLLTSAGYREPVVDVDRVDVGYPTLRRLVADLRAMGATNVLESRSRRAMSRGELGAAEATFAGSVAGGRSIERFEILHFAAWTTA